MFKKEEVMVSQAEDYKEDQTLESHHVQDI
jgi:hypothetical protein